MSGPPKKPRTLESLFSKSSRTSSVGSNPEKSSTSGNITGEEELESQFSIKEFDDTHVVEDAPVEETNPNVASTAAQANAAVSDRYDIGRAVRKTKRGEQLTDNERETYLSERWVPKRKDEYPYSEKKKPKKQLISGSP